MIWRGIAGCLTAMMWVGIFTRPAKGWQEFQPGKTPYIGTIAAQTADQIAPPSVDIMNELAGKVAPALQANATNAAQISAAGIVNAQNQPGFPPGSLVAIFGSGLAPSAQNAGGLPLATTLNGVTVRMNNIAVPLLYVGPLQINCQIPLEIVPGQVTVTVQNGTAVSNSVTVPVASVAPSIYAILNQDSSRNTAQVPGKAGGYVSLWGTGLGPTSPRMTTGASPPNGPNYALPTSPVSVTIGGLPAPVEFAGASPGSVGLFQVNVQVPTGASAGALDLVLTVGGASSPPFKVYVTAVAVAPPTITFTASPAAIQARQSSTLSWNVANATSTSIDNGIGTVVSSGTRVITPASSTTYTLTASGAGGTRTATVTVTVTQAPSCTVSPRGGAPTWNSDIVQFTGDLNKGDSYGSGLTVNAQSTVVLKSVSDYQNQTAIITPDQWSNFKNGSAFTGYGIFDGMVGAHTVTLAPGSYYVATRYFGNGATHVRYELDGLLQVPGASFVDYYLSNSTAVGANGGKIWQPFTIQCGFRYFLDGLNSGVEMYVIDASQIDNFKNGAAFLFYTDYSGGAGVVDEDQPDDYELKLPPGDYYLVYVNRAANTKYAVYTMARYQ